MDRKEIVKIKYLIVLSLLLVSCRNGTSEIIKSAEQEYNLTCMFSQALQDQHIQCFHDSIFLEDFIYMRCYNTTIAHQKYHLKRDRFREFATNAILDCTDYRVNMSIENSDKFIKKAVHILKSCSICTE